MKKVLFLFLLSLCFFLPCAAASTPAYDEVIQPATGHSVSPQALQKFAGLSIRQIEKIAGRHLKLIEKITIKIYQWKIKKRLTSDETGSKQGKTALIFGIAGAALFIAGLFLPYLLLGSLASAIVAVVLGSVGRKRNPDDKNALAGRLLGWITLGLLAVLVIIAVIAVASLL